MAYDNAQIKNWWTSNKVGQGGLTDLEVADAMDKYGVNATQLGSAVGHDSKLIQTRYDAARKKATTGATTGGILDSKLPVSDKLDTVKTVTPEKIAMEDADTVESRITNLIKTDSPLMQVARTQANQAGNDRGLLNSSMTVGAGEKAVIETATPIATQDAVTSGNFKLANQNATNAANTFNAGETNQLNVVNENNRQQSRNINQNTDAEKQLLEIRNTASKNELEIRGKYETLAAGNNAAANLLANHTNTLANIWANADIPLAQKQQAVTQAEAQLVTNLNLIGKMNNLNYGDLLELPGTAGSAVVASGVDGLKAAVDAANASSANEAEAIPKVFEYMAANNITAAQAAPVLGMTEAQINAKAAKVGAELPGSYVYDAKGGRRSLG